MTRRRLGRRPSPLSLLLVVLGLFGCGSSSPRDTDIVATDDPSQDSVSATTTSAQVLPSFSTRDGDFVASVLPSGISVIAADRSYENPVGDRIQVKIYSDRPGGSPFVIVTVNRGSAVQAETQDLAAQAKSRIDSALEFAAEDPVQVKGIDALQYQIPGEPDWTYLFWQEGNGTVSVAGYRLSIAELVPVAEGLRAAEGAE